MNWIDIIVVIVIFISGFISYKRGFLLSVFRFFSLAISIFISWITHPIVSEYLKGSKVSNQISNAIRESLFDNIQNVVSGKIQKESFIHKLQIPEILQRVALKNNDIINIKNDANNTIFVEKIIDFLTNICIGILSFILVFILVIILMKLCSKILAILSEIPIFKSVNKLVGLIFGLSVGIVEIWLTFIVLTFLFNTSNNGGLIFNSIDNSVVGKFLYENNLLSYIVAGIFKIS